MKRIARSLVIVVVAAGCSSQAAGRHASPTTHAPVTNDCLGEVSISPHPALPATSGIVSLSGLTKISSDAGGLSPFKGTGRAPAPNCTYTAVGGIGQFWVLSAAIARYGSADKVPLPIPLSVASKYPGPAEVNVDVLVFRDAASAQAVLHNPAYSTNPGWTKLPDTSIPGGNVMKVNSLSNGGLNEFLVQQAIRKTWSQVSVIGANLTLGQAEQVAESLGRSRT